MKIDKNKLEQLRGRAAALLYPRVCPVCNEILPKEAVQWPDPYICPECLDGLNFLDKERRCMRCSHPLEGDAAEFCPECVNKKRYFDTGLALMAHDDNARKIIYDLKFSSLKDNADMIAFELVRRAGRMAQMWGAQALIPVPLHKKRMQQRGFNQAQLIAEKFSEYARQAGFDIPPADSGYLFRCKATAPQRSTEQNMRAANIDGVFAVNIADIPYKRVILIDDIFTTGATLNECAKTLKQNGTSVVYFLSVSIVC